MKLKFLLLFFLSHIIYAQSEIFLDCKTIDKNDRYYNEVSGLLENNLLHKSKIKSSVRVAIHAKIIRKDDGSGGIGDSELGSAINELNNRFAPIGVSFFLLENGIVYIDSDELYNFDTDRESEIAGIYDVDNAVNLYLVNGFTSSIGGFSYFPDDDKRTNRVFSYYQDLNDMIYKVLPHEFGHYFGLFHTFQGNQTSNEEFVTRGIEANCEFGGDLLCDTPADPYGRLYIIGWLDCSFPYNFQDKKGVQYVPATNNLMSYYRGCGNEFTAGQLDMMSYGISRRLAPSSNVSESYTILGQNQSKGTVLTGTLVDGDLNQIVGDLCRSQEAFVNFESSLEEETEYEAWLISINNKDRFLLGEGKTSPISVSFEGVPEVYFPFYVQVVTKDESVFGSVPVQSYFLLDVPNLKISGDVEVFDSESGYFFFEMFGGAANFVLADSLGKEFEYSHYNSLGLIKQPIPVTESISLTVKSVSNQCGDGTGHGNARIVLKDIPVSTFVDIRCETDYWCIDASKEFEVFTLGGMPEIKKISVLDKEGSFYREILEYENEPSRLYLLASESSNLPEEFFIEFSFEGVLAPVRSEMLYLAKSFSKNISQSFEVFRGQSVQIPLDGLVSRNKVEVSFSDRSVQELKGINPVLYFNPVESGKVSVEGIINLGCQNIDLRGQVDFSVKEIVEIDVVRSVNSCIGDEVSTYIDVRESFFSDRPDVILYNELDIEVARIKGFLSNGRLSFRINEEIKETGFYYFRIVSLENFISKKSNKFQITVSPKINLLPVYGMAEKDKNILNFSDVRTPFKMYLSDGAVYECNEDQRIPVRGLSSGKYHIVGFENTCGRTEADLRFTVDQSFNNNFCIPPSDAEHKVGTISYLEISSLNGSGIKSRQVERNFFTDYVLRNKEVINLTKGDWYEIDVKDYNFELPTYFAGGDGSYSKFWIDLNGDGQFAEDESWTSTKYSGIRFQIPKETFTGYHGLRVRTFNEPPQNLESCRKVNFGETRDMILWIDDYQSPSLTIQASKELICNSDVINFSLSSNYQFPKDGVNVSLQDVQGIVLKDLGKLNPGSHSFTLNLDVKEFEFGLKLVAEDKSNSIVNQSQKLFVFSPAKLSIFRNIYGVSGKAATVFYNIEGGLNPKLDYLYNNETFTVGLDNYLNGPQAYTFTLNNVKESTLKPLRVYDNVCGLGEVSGKASVKVREKEDLGMELAPFSSFESAYAYQCSGSFSLTPVVKNVTEFPTDNFFTYVLVDGAGKLIETLGNVKQSEARIDYQGKLPPGWYYLEVFSSKPFGRSQVFSFEVKNTTEPNLQLASDFFEGSDGVLQVSVQKRSNVFSFNDFGLSNRIDARTFRRKLPTSSKFVRMEYRDSFYSCQEFRNVNFEFDASSRRSSELIAQKNIKACSQSGIGLTFLNDDNWELDNHFEVQMFNANGSFIESKLATPNGRELYSEPFIGLEQTEKYKLKVVSTNPYTESAFSDEFEFGEKLSATFGSDSALSAYAGISYPLEVLFEGEGPFSLLVNDSIKYEGLEKRISTIDFTPTSETSSVFLSQVIGECGNGIVNGLKPITLFEKPFVELASFNNDLYCQNQGLEINYNLKSGVFIDSAQLYLEAFDKNTNDFVKIKDLEGVNNTVTINPEEVSLDDGLINLRISSVNPDLSFNEEGVFLHGKPFYLPLQDETSVEGIPFSFSVGVYSSTDFEMEFNNSIFLTGKGGGFVNQSVTAEVPTDETFRVTHFQNACGEYDLDLFFKVDILTKKELANQVILFENPIRRWNSPLMALIPDFGTSSDMEVRIINSKGQIVNTLKLGKKVTDSMEGFYHIDVSDLSTGEYILQFDKDGVVFSKKIIVI